MRMMWWNNQRGKAVTVVLLLVLLLAACGDDEDPQKETVPEEATPTAESGLAVTSDAPDLNVGPGLEVNAPGSDSASDGQKLPGCSDPDASECPSPLSPTLDLIVSADGVQLGYYSRYWEALTGADASAVSEGAVIVVRPSEANKFALKGTFDVSFAESAEAVLDTLQGAEVMEWTAAGLGAGQVATLSDESVDPPVTTVYGLFDAGDGRVVILRMTATGQYSLDFHQDVYAAMLDSLVVVTE